MTCYTVFYVAALADTLAQPNCGYPWVPMATLEFLRVRPRLPLLLPLPSGQRWAGPESVQMTASRATARDMCKVVGNRRP